MADAPSWYCPNCSSVVRLPLRQLSDAEVLAEYRLRFPGTGDTWLDQIASTVELGPDATPTEIVARVAEVYRRPVLKITHSVRREISFEPDDFDPETL